jgi:hypothetical protein
VCCFSMCKEWPFVKRVRLSNELGQVIIVYGNKHVTVHVSWLKVTTQFISEYSIGITTSLLLDRFICAEVNCASSTYSVLYFLYGVFIVLF